MTAAASHLRRIGARAGGLWSMLRAPADDLSTPEARARERRRRAMLTSLMAMAAKAVSVTTALITVPITLRYLGAERYGMWIVLSSMVAMLSFTDFGIGNGVLNTVAAAFGRDDRQVIREAISSGTAALCAIAVAVVAALIIAYPYVEWATFFNVKSPLARAEAGPAIAAFVLCFAVAIPTNVVQRAQLGLQQGFLASAWLCAGSLFTLPTVLLAVHLEAGLPILIAVLMGAPLIAAVLNTLHFFGRLQRDLCPAPRHVRLAEIGSTTRAGGIFLFIQLGNSVIAGAIPIIIAHGVGPAAVTQYAVPERLLALVVMLVSMYVQPLWPAFREAYSKGDHDWIAATYQTTLIRVVVAAAIMLTVMGLVMPFLLYIWVGSTVQVPGLLVAGLCFYKVIESSLWINAMLLNGLNVIAGQAALAIGTAAVFVVAIYATSTMLGISLIPWIASAVVTICTLVPSSLMIRRYLHNRPVEVR